MKRFLKKRWHSIPIGIVAVLMALILVAGSAFAGFNVFMGNANVTVDECLTVSNTTGDGGEEFTGQVGNYAWNVSLYPGESRTLNVLVSNASSVAIPISAVGTGNEGVEAAWTGVGSVDGGSSTTLTLTVTADADAYPGTRTIFFKIERG